MLWCLVFACREIKITKVLSETGEAIKVHAHGVKYFNHLEFCHAPGPWDNLKASQVPIISFPTFHQ
jgi:hypothetical protein